MHCIHPYLLDNNNHLHPYNPNLITNTPHHYIMVPCGKCKGCKLDKSYQWANKIICESANYLHIYFITLTYSDPEYRWGVNWTNKDYNWHPTLKREDITKFIKRLRKELNFRYFLSGEYGDKYRRPHYHMILLTNHKLKLSDPIKQNNNNCKWIEKKWSLGKITCDEISTDKSAIFYTTQYTFKKQLEKKSNYINMNIEPPFISFSRYPALGSDWITKQLTNDQTGIIIPPAGKNDFYLTAEQLRTYDKTNKIKLNRINYKISNYQKWIKKIDQNINKIEKKYLNNSTF